MITPNPDHPAKYPQAVLDAFQVIVDREAKRIAREEGARRNPVVLDPFAGVGRIHDLHRAETLGVEIEPEWAVCRDNTLVGDATKLSPVWTESFDLVMTSPCYGNRMADHHNNRDKHRPCKGAGCKGCKGTGISPRKNYRVALGHDPSEGSAAAMQWGPEYRNLHRAALVEMVRVVRFGGLVVVNMKDHIRDKRVQPVVGWWAHTMEDVGLKSIALQSVATTGMRHGRNYEARVDGEKIITGRKR